MFFCLTCLLGEGREGKTNIGYGGIIWSRISVFKFPTINSLFKSQFPQQGCTHLPLCWSVWLENHITFLCELLWRFQVTNNRDFNPLFFQTICKSEPSKHMCSERVRPVVWRTLWFTASLWSTLSSHFLDFISTTLLYSLQPAFLKSGAANTDTQNNTW